MAVFNNILAGASGQAGGAAAGAENRSLRFNSADTPSLTRAITTGKTTWTLSLWVKRTNLSNYHCIFSSGSSGANATGIFFDTASGTFYAYGSGNNYYSTEVYRDFSAWYHIVISVNSNSGTVYVNGQSVTFSPSLAFTTLYNNAVLGTYGTGGLYYFNGYMADVHFIDGQALAATDFGELDDNGVWQPIAYAGTYGTDGAHLPFSDNSSASALGTDDSGNGNDWTVNNIATGSAPSGSNVGLYLADGTPTAGSISDMFDGDTSTTYYYRAIGGTLTLYFTEPVSGDFVITAADGTSLTNSGGGYKLYDSSGTLLVNQASPTTITTNTHSSLSNVKKLEMIGGSGYGGIQIFEISVSGVTFQETLNPPDDDSLLDSPTNGDTANDTGAGGEVPGNYCTWNPLQQKGTITLSNGNLDVNSASTAHGHCGATFAVSSGKWYWELTKSSSTAAGADGFGFAKSKLVPNPSYDYLNLDAGKNYIFTQSNTIYMVDNGTTTSVSSASAANDAGVYMFAYDFDNGKGWAGKDGVWWTWNALTGGDPANGTNPVFDDFTAGDFYTPVMQHYTASNPYSANFGQRPFAYSAPSGFKALCTANLDTPTIEDGSTAMDVVTWTGNGTSQTISGLEFSPDFVWIKDRSSTAYHHFLANTISGTNKALSSSQVGGEVTYSSSLTAFNSDGFDLGTELRVNASGSTYVAWNWDGGASTVANTDGSISTSVRANANAGFSLISYTGTGSSGTLGHGLNIAPEFFFIKSRDGSTNWMVYHKGIGPSYYLVLEQTYSQQAAGSDIWQGTNPTSSVISIGDYTYLNSSGTNYLAYCWAPVEGYSAFGSYTGNGSSTGDGPFIYTGFRIKFLMIKIYSGTTSNWVMLDSARDPDNVVQNNLYADTSDAENQFDWADFLSNGFKLRVNYSQVNGSGYSYLYCAFAENPFRSARAR